MSDGIRGAQLLVSVAEGAVGLGTKANPDAFAAFVYAYDDLKQAHAASKSQSSCMVTCMRILERSGVVGKGFDKPYLPHSGTVGTMLVTEMSKLGAWVDLSRNIPANFLDENPKFGQMYWIGLENNGPVPGWGGVSHMLTMVDQQEAELSDGTKFDLHTSVEGGKWDGVGYCINRCFRRVERVGNTLWLREMGENPKQPGTWKLIDAGRRVWGMIDPYRGKLKDILDAEAEARGILFTMDFYQTLCADILGCGKRVRIRNGTDCIRLQGASYHLEPELGFPLLTTKHVSWAHQVVEALWLLSGDLDLSILHRHGIHYWDKWMLPNGEIPSAYGHHWRHFPRPDGGHFDQVRHVLEAAVKDPTSRRLLVTAWEPLHASRAALPPCHVMFHLVLDETSLGFHLHQRSCDVAVGLPYNVACYALLHRIFARIIGKEVGTFSHSIVDAHIYAGNAEGKYNHLPGIHEQMSRLPYPQPTLTIDPCLKTLDDFLRLTKPDVPLSDLLMLFRLEGYVAHPKIDFEVMP